MILFNKIIWIFVGTYPEYFVKLHDRSLQKFTEYIIVVSKKIYTVEKRGVIWVEGE